VAVDAWCILVCGRRERLREAACATQLAAELGNVGRVSVEIRGRAIRSTNRLLKWLGLELRSKPRLLIRSHNELDDL